MQCENNFTKSANHLLKHPPGNTVSKGEDLGPSALALSTDDQHLAFVGPLEFTITILFIETLDEVVQLD